MKVVYIAGCFRGPTAWSIKKNVVRAEAMGLRVAEECRVMPLIPHKNTENFHGCLDDEFWLAGTLELMKRCDAVMLVDRADVDVSHGTQREVEVADEIGIPVFDSIEKLQKWLWKTKAA